MCFIWKMECGPCNKVQNRMKDEDVRGGEQTVSLMT